MWNQVLCQVIWNNNNIILTFHRIGVSVGVGYGLGAGVEGGLNKEDKNVGGTLHTPIGSFGAQVGCKNKICLFGCFSFTFC